MKRNSRLAGGQGVGQARGLWGRLRATRIAAGTAVAMLAGLLAAVPGAIPARAAVAGGGSPARTAASGANQGKLALLDMVVLVDESGSETAQKVADEKATVGTIVQSLLNPTSRVTVIGFGGVNHVVPNQVPTDVACVPTIASGAANLGYLSSCVSKLHRRTQQEGDDTDYAAALGQAMSYLSPDSTATPPSPSGAIKVILLLTDGAADVHRNTQQYGTGTTTVDGVNMNLGEQTAISTQLAAAKQDSVEVWPLGFGSDAGTGISQSQAKDYLSGMASQGAPAVCDQKLTANQPHATWVNNPDDAINALDQLYADAACVGSQTVQGPASSRTLTLSIPQIASAAAISVDRGNPAITVSFETPSGQAWGDASAVSGQDSPVEVLHLYNITQADVGSWKINLTAPSNLADQLVRATDFWQGAVRAIITANPPSAKLGQQIGVNLDVLGPNGPISDPTTLSSLIVGVTVTGNGLPGTVGVAVHSVAGSPGHYTGTYTAPTQATSLTFTGTASGYGLFATEVPATVGVGTQTQGFTATPGFSSQGSVQVGSTVSGQVVFTNQTGSARRVRLVLSASGATAALSSPTGPVTVPSGNPPSVPFTITVDKGSPTGTALFQVQAVDAATGQVYNTAEQDFAVTKPPGFLAKYWWLLVLIAALVVLAILAAIASVVASKRRRDVRHLVASLRRGGTPTGRDLEPEDKWAETFPFIIRDEASGTPRLDHPPRDAAVAPYQVRRAGRGMVRVTTPTGLRPYDVEVGGPGLRMENGLELSFRDTRHPEWVGSGRTEVAATAHDWSGSGTSGLPAGARSGVSPDDWGGSGGMGAGYDWSGSGMPTVPTAPAPAPSAPAPTPPTAPDFDRGTMPTMPVTRPVQPPSPDDPWM